MNRKILGIGLKKVRKAKGLKITDLANETISTATISNIERGVETVQEKYLHIYANLLGTNLNNLNTIIDKEVEDLKQQLTFVELLINVDKKQIALKKINKIIKNNPNNLMIDFIYYLKAQCYFHIHDKKKLNQSEKYLLKSIDVSANNKNNIRAACLKDLSRIVFFRDYNLKRALELADKGLKQFNESGENKEIKYFLLVGKASYLEKLNKTDNALQILLELWNNISKIENINIKLNMYEIRALCHYKNEEFDKAIKYALKGIKLAYTNQEYDSLSELLTTWGKINMRIGNFALAEECFHQALELKPQLKRKYLCVSPYTQLGRMYCKLKKWDDAEKNLKLAIIEGKKADMHRRNEAHIAFGDLYFLQEKYQEAIEPYEKALYIAEKHNFEYQQINLLLNLSDCYQILEDKNKYLEMSRKLHLLLKANKSKEVQ